MFFCHLPGGTGFVFQKKGGSRTGAPIAPMQKMALVDGFGWVVSFRSFLPNPSSTERGEASTPVRRRAPGLPARSPRARVGRGQLRKRWRRARRMSAPDVDWRRLVRTTTSRLRFDQEAKVTRMTA